MGRIFINIDWVPNNFAAAPANQNIACVATGQTLEEVQHNILEALEFHIQGLLEAGETLPKELVGPLNADYHLTTRAQLKYTDNYLSRKALARETGIAEQQLSHYANGQRHPRPAMQKRISDGILAIAQRLYHVL